MARGRKRTRRKQLERRRLSEQYRRVADSMALEGDIRAALEGYELAATIDETNAEALVALGDAYVFTEMPAEAYRAYKKALAVHPRHAAAHASLAEFLARHGHLKQAIRAQERAVQCDPKRSYLHYRLAMLYQRDGRFDHAEERLNQAIALDEGEALYHYKLGELRAHRGQWAEAVGCYQAATRCSPLDDFYLVRLAAALIRLQRRPDALMALERAVCIDPHNRAHRYLLGELLVLMGRLEAGNEQIRRAGGLDQYDRDYIGRIKLRSGQLLPGEELIIISAIEVPV